MVPEPNSASGSGTARDVESVKVPSKDPKKKDEKKDEDLSEEDLALMQQLELYVERVQDSDPVLQKVALESIRQEIRTSTSSMTSVPKPLKFLRPHYGTLKAHYETLTASDIKKLLADILSVLTLTMSAEGERESLKYRLLGSEGDIGSWGHKYVRTKMGDATKENIMESVRSVVFKQSETLEGFCTKIEGYDFNRGVNYTELLSSMLSTGFQASNLGDAIQVVNQMLDWRLADESLAEDCSEEEREPAFRESVRSKLFLGFTSNLVSSGVRDTIRYLVQHHTVDVVVTTAGGVEEDLIKCLAPTYKGDFSLAGAALRSKGLNRIGNLLVPNDNYCKFEDWIIPIFDQMLEEQTKKGVLWTPSKVISRLGKEINHESSYLYWAYKNNIPVYCPGITDGSLGDMLYFHSFRNPGLVIDLVQDIRAMNSEAVHASPRKTGMIILGGGLPKHHICNANMMRNGADFAVFINTAQEFDGSDSGARPDEAVSWGKIRSSAKTVKVHCDATIAFPLLVAETFAARRKNYPETKP